MITLYSGTPGSGKSLHASRKISEQLLRKRDVIANFPINEDIVTRKGKKQIGRFTYLNNKELTVAYLKDYAVKYHRVAVEGQTIIVIDEAGTLFNSREASAKERKDWLEFFAIHRHYGFDMILISQHSMQLDRQIRYKIEYDVKHKKANNFKTMGLILTLLQVKTFVAVTYWFNEKERIGAEVFRFRKRDARLYQSMMLFDELIKVKKSGIIQHAQTNEEKTLSPEADQQLMEKPARPITELFKQAFVQTVQKADIQKDEKNVFKMMPGIIEQKRDAPQDVDISAARSDTTSSDLYEYEKLEDKAEQFLTKCNIFGGFCSDCKTCLVTA